MEQTQEYLTGNRWIRYPFADDTSLSTSDDQSLHVFGCFVDAYVQIKSSDREITPKVSGIAVSGNTISFILFGEYDEDGSVARCDDMAYLTCTASKTRFITIHGETDWCWYAFVMSSDGIREFQDNVNGVGDISSDELLFSDRCLGSSAKSVTSLLIYGGEQTDEITKKRYTRLEALNHPADRVVSGDVTLVPGNNMSFAARKDYSSIVYRGESNGITLNAIPGEGMGRVPCRCDDVIEYRAPGILSPDGHTRLFNDTCYDLQAIEYSQEYSKLKMHVKCKACCTCEMYVAIVNDRLVPLKNEIIDIKNSLDTTHDTYTTNVEKWNTRLATAYPEDIVISTTALPLDAAATDLKGDNISGKMSRCGFSVMVKNDSFVNVDIAFSKFTSNGDIFEAQVSYMDENLKPKIVPARKPLWKVNIMLPPGRSATLTCFVRLRNMVKTDEQTGFIASVNVTAKQGQNIILSRNERVSI